jgi:GrpB-like predicted nucleotidyltransferase (UPF0157 family)
MRDRYAVLKRDPAVKFGDNREAYAEAKGAFMREVFAWSRVE